VVFTLIGVFALLTVTMAIGLIIAHVKGVPPVPAEETVEAVSLGQPRVNVLLLNLAVDGLK